MNAREAQLAGNYMITDTACSLPYFIPSLVVIWAAVAVCVAVLSMLMRWPAVRAARH